MEEQEPNFESELDRQLFKLELTIAQRADQLARLLQKSEGHSFELWRQAESEILATWADLKLPPVAAAIL